MDKKSISGFVLTGGKSSRMGEDKGLMIFDRKPLVQHALETLDQVAGQVMISANDSVYAQFSHPVVPDAIHDIDLWVVFIRAFFDPKPNSISFSRVIHRLCLPNYWPCCYRKSAIMRVPCRYTTTAKWNRCAPYIEKMLETFAELINEGRYKVHEALDRLGMPKSKSTKIRRFTIISCFSILTPGRLQSRTPIYRKPKKSKTLKHILNDK